MPLEKWGKENIDREDDENEDEATNELQWQQLVEFGFMETFGE